MANRTRLRNYNKGTLMTGSTDKMLKQVKADKVQNLETGEIEDVYKIVLESGDFNFEKIWIGHLLQSLDALGSKKLKVAMFLMSVRDNDNFVNLTYDEMAESTAISKRTIIDTVKILIGEDFMKKIRNGKYLINPDLVWKGSRKGRMSVLIEYNNVPMQETKVNDNPLTYVQTDENS